MSKSNIVKWVNPSYGPTRKLAIDFTSDRDAIIIRAAKEGDKEADTFDPVSELGDLWLTLKKSGHNVSAMSLMLSTDKIDEETGMPMRIQGAIPNPKKPEYAYAYTPKQLEEYDVPKFLFIGANLAMHGMPWFSCSKLPYQGKRRTPSVRQAKPKPSVVRMTAAPTDTGIVRQRKA